MAEHSMTPWKVVPTNTYLFIKSAQDGIGYLAGFRGIKAPAGESAANARYTVAAVNACAAAGPSVEALEDDAVARLVSVVRTAVRDLAIDYESAGEVMRRLNKALAPFEAAAKETT